MQDRVTIESMRRSAAECLASSDAEVRARAEGFLRMVQVLLVKMLSRGEDVQVTSQEGSRFGLVQGRTSIATVPLPSRDGQLYCRGCGFAYDPRLKLSAAAHRFH